MNSYLVMKFLKFVVSILLKPILQKKRAGSMFVVSVSSVFLS